MDQGDLFVTGWPSIINGLGFMHHESKNIESTVILIVAQSLYLTIILLGCQDL